MYRHLKGHLDLLSLPAAQPPCAVVVLLLNNKQERQQQQELAAGSKQVVLLRIQSVSVSMEVAAKGRCCEALQWLYLRLYVSALSSGKKAAAVSVCR